jgi:hypothetical protein
MSAPAAGAHHDRMVPFFTAILAVLAALGTLFSHHRSIQALALRNEALLLTAKASDQYGYYQTEQLKVTLYQALLSTEASRDEAQRGTLRAALDAEQRSSIGVASRAKNLEAQASQQLDHAQSLLTSFETLEISTTLFEISIAFASIAALTDARLTLWIGAFLSLFGLVLAIVGYFQAH